MPASLTKWTDQPPFSSIVVFDEQGPLWFFKLDSGPERGLGSVTMNWDSALEAQVGVSQCGNGNSLPCDAVGRIKHLGWKYSNDTGLPVNANADITGPVGGFGWKLELDKGAPKSIRFSEVEMDPATPLLISIAYPPNTKFNISAIALRCIPSSQYTCRDTFYQVASVAEVRTSIGNTYHVSTDGVLTLRVIQTPKSFVGRPEFFLPQYTDEGRGGYGLALERYERDGILLPAFTDGNHLLVEADCPSVGPYCSVKPKPYDPDVCPTGYVQTGYDTCSLAADPSMSKIFADGSSWTVGQ